MGFFWGVDQDETLDLLKKLFFDKVRTQKPGKSSLSVLVQSLNRSGVVELVGREPWIIARVENGVTNFFYAAKTVKRQNFQKKLDQENSFQWGIFIFLAAGKLTFLGGGITSKLASQ